MNPRKFFPAFALVLFQAVPVSFAAATVWVGTGTSSWFVTTNWSPAAVPVNSSFVFVDVGTAVIASGTGRADQFVVGHFGTGVVRIESGASLSVAGSALGTNAGSQGTLDILGGSWINSMVGDSVWIGNRGTGIVNLRDNGSMSMAGGAGWVVLGQESTGTGTLNVGAPSGSTPAAPGTIAAAYLTTGSGAGTVVFNHTSANYYLTKTGAAGGAALGLTGRLALRVENGVTVLTGTANHTGGTTFQGGTLRVGAGGYLLNAPDTGLSVAHNSGESGTMEIRSGGVVSSALATVGYNAGASGTVSISGTGSEWNTTNNGLPFIIGRSGQGEVTLSDGGRLLVANGEGAVNLGALASAQGTLNIGSPTGQAASASGIVGATGIYKGAGSGKLVFNHTSVDYYLTNNGASGGSNILLSGALSLHHIAGTTTLRGSNTYSGGTRLSGGRLFATNSGALGTSTITIDGEGASLGYRADFSLANAVTLQAGAYLEVLAPRAVQDGVISESGGSFGFTKIGSGTLVLTGSNSYTGGTTLAEGALEIGNDFALGSGTLTVAHPDAWLSYRGTRTVANAVVVTGTLTIGRLSSESESDPDSFQLSGDIGEAGNPALVVIRDSYDQGVELSGNNSYSGGTEVLSGRLTISQDANLGAASAPLWVRSGTVKVSGDTASSRPIEFGWANDASSSVFEVTENKTFSTSATLHLAGAGAVLSKKGAGTLVANGVSSAVFNAALRIEEGTFGTTGSVSPVISLFSSATLQIGDGGTLSAMPELSFDTVETGSRIAFYHSNDLLVVNTPLPWDATLVQAGSGTTELPGDWSFAEVEVKKGGLIANELSAINLSVSEGASLEIRRSSGIHAAVIEGALALGAATEGSGIFSFTNITLETSAILIVGIESTGVFDQIEIQHGSLSFGGMLALQLGLSYVPEVGDAFQIFDMDDLISRTGNFAQIRFSNPAVAGAFDPETGMLTITAVPEPGSVVLVGLALVAVGFTRWRTRLR